MILLFIYYYQSRYPDNFGWQVNAPRSVLRRSQEFSKFQKFIVSETEAVSNSY